MNNKQILLAYLILVALSLVYLYSTNILQSEQNKHGATDVDINNKDHSTPNKTRTVQTFLKEKKFIESLQEHVFMFGAVGCNSSINRIWDHYKVYGQWQRNKRQSKQLKCCLKYDDTTVQIPAINKLQFYQVALQLFHVICLNPRHKDGIVANEISITGANIMCNSNTTLYTAPYYPAKQKEGSFAITTKVSHGNLSSNQVISWMEAYRWLGVDKVITYATRRLCDDTRRVLEFYASTGFLELYSYDLAGKDQVSRQLHIQNKQVWTDTEVTLHDAFERNHGYTYFAMIDWDEFIIPSRNRTLKQLLSSLFERHSDAVGFQFTSQYFLTSVHHQDSDEFLKQFVYRTNVSAVLNRQKLIYKPSLTTTISTHAVTGIPGYKTFTVPTDEAFIRHYRSCVPLDSEGRLCDDNTVIVKDASTAKWADNISQRVLNVKADIFSQK